MLIEADTRRERKVRTHPYKQATPVAVVDVEVVLVDPTLADLQMPAIVLLIADGSHDAGRLPCLEDDGYLIRLGSLQVRFHEFIAPAGRCIEDWRIPFLRPVFRPVLKLIGDLGQHVPAHREFLPVGGEEANGSFGLLKGLDQTIQQNSVETTIVEPDAILVMFVKGVHGNLQQWSAIWKLTPWTPLQTRLRNFRDAWDIKGEALG